MMMVIIDLMMGVQGRISTTDGISAAVHHSPLIHESGRRDEAKVEQHKIHKPSPGPFIWNEFEMFLYQCRPMLVAPCFFIFFLRC